MRMITCQIDAAYDGGTVESVLRYQLRASVRCIRRAKQRADGILLDGEPSWTPQTVRAGQTLSLAIDDVVDDEALTPAFEPGPVAAVYADRDLVIVDKPSDLVMYPGPGHPHATLLNRMLAWFSVAGIEGYPHAVNRIDRGTTGLVVFATTSYAHDILQRQLHTRAFERTYLALCEGMFEDSSGIVDAPIARIERERISFAVDASGKPARTFYHVRETVPDGPAGPLSLVELRLETGRTHQIRLHMAHLGHPLIGDGTYGRLSAHIARPALHSWRVALDHPLSGERVRCAAPLPADMVGLLPKGLADSLAVACSEMGRGV